MIPLASSKQLSPCIGKHQPPNHRDFVSFRRWLIVIPETVRLQLLKISLRTKYIEFSKFPILKHVTVKNLALPFGFESHLLCFCYPHYRVLGNFRELPAELKFRVLIFANGDLTIYISYIANAFVLI